MEQFGGRAGSGDETGQQEVEGWEEIDEKTPRRRSETEREKRGIREKAAKNAKLKCVNANVHVCRPMIQGRWHVVKLSLTSAVPY